MESPFSNSLDRGHIFKSDLESIVRHADVSLEALRSARILIAGGTGFVGTWLTSTLLKANDVMSLDLELVLVSRNHKRAAARINSRAGDALRVVESGLESLSLHHQEFEAGFTHIIHAANSTANLASITNIDSYIHDARKSTENLLTIASTCATPPVFMHLSSGAVYGLTAREKWTIAESAQLEEENPFKEPYGHIKRVNESLVERATSEGRIQGTNPRLFAFSGPHIPLDQHFAIGNFMKTALLGEQITMLGNPLTTRSYLYPTDLVEWLLAVLQTPTIEPVHIGSDIPLEMREIASTISKVFENVEVSEGDVNIAPNHYVPETTQTRATYGLSQRIFLDEAIQRWRSWLATE